MITLKNAREKAVNLTESKIPKVLSLHHWKNIGVISGVIDYKIDNETGGKSGLYPDYVVIEMVTAAELKGRITLKGIGEIRQEIIERLEDQGKNLEDIAGIESEAGSEILSNTNLLRKVGLIDLGYQELLKIKLMDMYLTTFWKVRNRLYNKLKEVRNNDESRRNEEV